MIHNPFISQFYPGLTTWLNFAQLYQAVPEDYEITRVGKGFRISAASKNKGANGVVAVEYTRTPVGYLDPTEPIYFDKEEFDGGVSLTTQILHNTTISLADKLIDRFETNDEGGVLHLKAGTPWGEEPVSIPVKFYNVKSVVSELTFRLTENKTVSFEWLTEGSVTLNKKTYTSNSPSLTLEAGEHHFSSDQPLGVLGTLFEQLGKPAVVSLIKVVGTQGSATVTGMSDLVSSIESVAPGAIYIDTDTKTNFRYFNVPTTNIQSPIFSKGSEVWATHYDLFGDSIVDRFPDDVFAGAKVRAIPNFLFMGSTIDVVQEKLFHGLLEKHPTTVLNFICTFYGCTVQNFSHDILSEGIHIGSLTSFLQDAYVDKLPRVIPGNNYIAPTIDLRRLYQGITITEKIVEIDPFSNLTDDLTFTPDIEAIFNTADFYEFSVPVKLPNLKFKNLNGLFYGSSLRKLPLGLFDNLETITSLYNSFRRTHISEIPDEYFKNVEVSDFSSCFADCSSLKRVGSKLFKPGTTVTIDYMFASLNGYTGNTMEFQPDTFDNITIRSATSLFAKSVVDYLYISSPLESGNMVLKDALVHVLATHGLTIKANLTNTMSGASIGVMCDECVVVDTTDTNLTISDAFNEVTVGILPKSLFKRSSVAGKYLRGRAGNTTGLLSPKIVNALGTIPKVREFLGTDVTYPVLLSGMKVHLDGNYWAVVDAFPKLSTTDSAKAFIPESTRFKEYTGNDLSVSKLRVPERYFGGYLNNGLNKRVPLLVSYYNKETSLNGIDRNASPMEWFTEWMRVQKYENYPHVYYRKVGEYHVFSPSKEVPGTTEFMDYEYVFHETGNPEPKQLTPFDSDDWFTQFIMIETQNGLPAEHGTFSQVTDGSSGVGKIVVDIKPEFASRYLTKSGTVRIDGFYGSMQRIIDKNFYTIPKEPAYDKMSAQELCDVILQYTGYRFKPEMLSGSVFKASGELTIGITPPILGTYITMTLRD